MLHLGICMYRDLLFLRAPGFTQYVMCLKLLRMTVSEHLMMTPALRT
jgi:hypothetical protein